jgi:hypothetical protein
MVGLTNGQVMKINFDFKEEYFQSPIIYPTACAKVEFMHSLNASNVNAYITKY